MWEIIRFPDAAGLLQERIVQALETIQEPAEKQHKPFIDSIAEMPVILGAQLSDYNDAA